MAEESTDQNSISPPLPLPPPPPLHGGGDGGGGGYYAEKSKAFDDAIPWIEYAVEQAQLYQKIIVDAVEEAVSVSKDRIDRIRTTSSVHFNQTLDSLEDVKSEYVAYEHAAFGMIKEGILVAASHPLMTSGAVLGLGFLGLKRPRRFLYYNTMRLFTSEEAMLSKADARVKELRKTVDLLKAEREKIEKTASQAEEELIRGRKKLKQAGKQIQSVIRSAYKIERQAGGLRDILKELPSIESSRFRSQVSNLASEAKRERSALAKEVAKISNYGISV